MGRTSYKGVKRSHRRRQHAGILIHGNFDGINEYLRQLNKPWFMAILDKYGKKGVQQLRLMTPRDTGKTAESWSYHIENRDEGCAIVWQNGNVVDGWAKVALLIQYGHATGDGYWIESIDYINPALFDVFQGMAEEIREGIRRS